MPGLIIGEGRAQVLPLLFGVIAASSISFADASGEHPNLLCGVLTKEWELRPIGSGPMRLIGVRCFDQVVRNAPLSFSPDGNALFTFDDHQGLSIGSTKFKPPLVHFETHSNSYQLFGPELPVTWSSDSRSVMGVRQDYAKPLGGWALGQQKPYRFSLDGKAEPLPELSNDAGPLDELHWLGNSGLAVALFGTRGAYYKPEHSDPNPTIAFVDARVGRVIQALSLKQLVQDPSAFVDLAWRIDKDRLPEVLFSLSPHHWFIWRQGDASRHVPINVSSFHKPFALSPDGKSAIFMKGLSADGWICEQDPHCPPPIPKTGPVAELRDLGTGQVLWSLVGTAERFSNDGQPVISPDGKYALISMPAGDRSYTIALVAMAEGKILQRIPSPGPFHVTMKFLSDSRHIWVSGLGRLVVYLVGQ